VQAVTNETGGRRRESAAPVLAEDWNPFDALRVAPASNEALFAPENYIPQCMELDATVSGAHCSMQV
jgi:hypothetical protein